MELVLVRKFKEALRVAKRAIQKGDLVIYPTDTLYGIGANALSKSAVEKVLEAKRREAKPISIAVSSLEMLARYCKVDGKTLSFLAKILPGPYTVILKSNYKFPENLLQGAKGIGVRIPEHKFTLALVSELGFPITATSANVSGEKSAWKLGGISAEIAGKAKVVIDGECRWKEGSTVVDMIGKPKVIRKGAGIEKLMKELKTW